MRLQALSLHTLRIPLGSAFTTSFGTQEARTVLLVRAIADESEGWGECVTIVDPVYTSEYTAGARQVIMQYLAPAVLAKSVIDIHNLQTQMANVIGHQMAKSAVETAILDAYLKTIGMSMSTFLGGVRDRVACGVSVGIAPSIDALLAQVSGYLDDGYRRIKLKIKPGWDIEPVRAVREAFGTDLLLSVDANTSYGPGSERALLKLEDFDLLMIEQPFPAEDIDAHARLAEQMATAICLDESITSAKSTASAIQRGACSIVNIKPGRVGGYLESRRIHDVCEALGVPVWCGGMLETGIGRAANVALAALPGFVLPNDTSASDRYFSRDITEPFVLEDGYLRVPTGPGIGVTVRPEVVAEYEESSDLVLAASG